MATVNQTLQLKASPVFQKNYDAFYDPKWKIIVNQGGTRSTKTYSILQLFIVHMMNVSGEIITAARKTSPSLRSSIIRDFIDILNSLGLYNVNNHNKTDREYRLNNNTFEFVSSDDPQKKRGTKRNHLWLNETNEFNYEDFFQFMIRTSGKIFFDYNPSDEYSWIYDKVLTRNDCLLIKSTYNDNPFLEKTIVDEIERLKEQDDNYWKIYGLGEVGKRKSIIYNNWDLIDKFPTNVDEMRFGIDYGFNNPNVLVKVGRKDVYDIFIEQIIYETRLTNNQFIDKIKQELKDYKRFRYIADSAAPDKIEEMVNAGLNVEACKKGEGSVKNGIDLVNRTKLHIVKSSSDVLKEIKSYKWKEDKKGNILDEPVPFNDHAMDGIRYAVSDMQFPSDLAIKIFGKQNEERTIYVPTRRADVERANIRRAVKVGGGRGSGY